MSVFAALMASLMETALRKHDDIEVAHATGETEVIVLALWRLQAVHAILHTSQYLYPPESPCGMATVRSC